MPWDESSINQQPEKLMIWNEVKNIHAGNKASTRLNIDMCFDVERGQIPRYLSPPYTLPKTIAVIVFIDLKNQGRGSETWIKSYPWQKDAA